MKRLLILLLILFVGCTGHVVKEDPFVIGGLFGLTGYVSSVGENSRNGFLMAIEDYNGSVDYVIEDFQSPPQKTVTAARKLIDVDNADVIIGPEWGEFGAVISPLSVDEQQVFIGPWWGGEPEWIESPYLFSATTSERPEITITVEHMKAHDVKDLAVVYAVNDWAVAHKAILEDVAKEKDITLYEYETTDLDDYRTILVKIQDKDVDAIFAILPTFASQGKFNTQLVELGIDAQLYVPFSIGNSKVVQEEFSTVSEGLIYPAAKQTERLTLFNEKYKARWGEEPTAITAATAYDMTTLILQAKERGFDTSEELRVYLDTLEAYEGYANTYTFNTLGMQEDQPVVLKQINQGKAYIIG